MFKKIPQGKYDLYEVLEALYSEPELRGTGIAKEILERLDRVNIGYLRMTMLKNIPKSRDFRSEQKELLIIYEYAKVRLQILKRRLLKIDNTYN